jgi:transcriptional repressor NrdR
MKCPFCDNPSTNVIDKRPNEALDINRRRRECERCEERFTTYERVEWNNPTVVKKDSSREQFDRNKVLNGILKACERRPISRDIIEKTVNSIEKEIRYKNKKEIPSKLIGEMVIRKLKSLDKVAYIRFASVYREFEDITSFEKELKMLKARGR